MVIINELKFLIKKLWAIPFFQYPIQICFLVTEKLTLYHHEKDRFKSKTGYKLNLENPKSFNEKIVWKKIHDRNPLYPIIADKYKVRGYIEKILGKKEAENILVPLLYVTEDPSTIPFDSLPSEYVIKANHGSATNIIVEKNTPINKYNIIKQFRKWMRTPYGFFLHEWPYQKIDRKIIIEKLLRDEMGNLPRDYKFHMIHGDCVMIQVNQGPFYDKAKRAISLYDVNWNKLDVYWEFPIGENITKPDNFDKMLTIAKKLSSGFDYIRVDLYSIDNNIYFGELTLYPTSGTAKVIPLDYDFELGNTWEIDTTYKKNGGFFL